MELIKDKGENVKVTNINEPEGVIINHLLNQYYDSLEEKSENLVHKIEMESGDFELSVILIHSNESVDFVYWLIRVG